MYLIIGKVDGHIEEKNESKYLVFDFTDENKEVLKKYANLWDGIKNEIKTNKHQKSNLLHFNDIINIQEFDSDLLKTDTKSYKDTDIYYFGYITIKKIDDCENIYSVNPLYLVIGKVDGHIEEKNESKYLAFDFTDENEKVLKKYANLWDGIKNEIKTNKHQKSNLLHFNDIINIQEFDSNLLKTDTKSYKDTDIYYIGYITIKKIDDCENIYSVNPLYLVIGKVDGHIEEKNESKYLAFDFTDENKEVLKKYTKLWYGIKNEIKTNKHQKSNLLHFNDIINIQEFDSNLLKTDTKSYKDTDIYYIGYITIKKIDACENIYSVNPLYLIIGKVDGHIKEKNKSKYLAFDFTDENKEVSLCPLFFNKCLFFTK